MSSLSLAATLRDLRFGPDGLIAAIVQQHEPETPEGAPPTGRVLMLAYLNRESLELTLSTRRMHYWSRSRGKLWLKGETSGHFQEVVSWHRDCDGDALLFVVRQTSAACHTGYQSCFFQALNFDGVPSEIREERRFEPEKVYAKGE